MSVESVISVGSTACLFGCHHLRVNVLRDHRIKNVRHMHCKFIFWSSALFYQLPVGSVCIRGSLTLNRLPVSVFVISLFLWNLVLMSGTKISLNFPVLAGTGHIAQWRTRLFGPLSSFRSPVCRPAWTTDSCHLFLFLLVWVVLKVSIILNVLTSWNRVVLEAFSWSRNCPHLMQSIGSLSCPQEPATCLCPEPD